MRKFLIVALVIVSVITFSCDTVDTSFDDALPERYTLTTTVIPSGAGVVIPSEGNFVAGSSIAIEAIPNDGYIFRNWDGDLSGNLNPRSVLFTGNRNVRAHFLFRNYPLNVEIIGQGTVNEEVISQAEQSVTGTGTATMLPLGGATPAIPGQFVTPSAPDVDSIKSRDDQVDHGGDTDSNKSTASETVQATTVTVRLTAQPAEGWVFDRWEGDLTGNQNPETIVVDEEKNVTAVFVQDQPDLYTLAVQVQGQGSVSVDPVKDQYESGEQVTLTATASGGWRFSGWQGDLSGSTNPATLVMNADKSVTAVFVQDEPDLYTLAVQVQGQGSVSVDPAKDQYESGEQVTLTATASGGWRFSGWQGDLSGSTNPATLVMNAEKSVTAVFVQDEPDLYTLAVQVQGQGSVSVDPAKDQYESGEQVTLTATATVGWRFTGWQGDLSGSTNPATLVMNADKSVTAVFVQDEPDLFVLAVQVQGQGSVSVDPAKDQYESGEQVTLTATASQGWRFMNWQGDLSGNTNPATLQMNADKSVTAVFRQVGPSQMEILQQPSESTAGSALVPAPAVKLSDDLGSPISGSSISVSLNNNTFTSGSSATIATNEDGEAVFDNLIIETAATGYRITFDSDVQDAPVVQSDPFDIRAAAPVAENSTADVTDGTAGEQTLIQITVRDQFDNPVAGTADQLRVGVSGANSASPVVIETSVQGRYSAVYTPASAGTDQIAIEFSGTPISGSPYTSTVSSGAAESIEMISGNNQNGRINQELDAPFVVRVVDKSGNPVAGVTVQFTITDTPLGAIGQRMSNTSATTNTDGLASSRLTLGSMPGEYQVVASAGDVGSVTFRARAELLPPSLLTIVQQPASTVAGTSIDPAPSVRVTDSENNPVEGVAIIVSLNGGEFSDGSTTEVISGANGISGFGNLVINAAASGYTLTFSSLVSGLADVTTQSFTVRAAAGDPASSIAVVPDGVAGQETSIIIRVEDAYGNPTGNASDLTVDVAGKNEDNLSVNDLDNPGEFIAEYKPETAGTDVITIRLLGVEISGSPYSSVVSPADVDPSDSTVDADPEELKVGETSTVTIVLRDKYQNLISGFAAADFVVSFDGVASAGPVSETSVAGTYQFEVTSDTPGEVEVYVTAGGIALDDNPEIEFLPEISYSLGMYIQPENSKVNQPVIGPPAVRLTSDAGSVVSGIPVTVRERGGQPIASGTLTVNTNADGIARFTDLVFSVRGRYQLEFTAPLDGPINSRSFQVSP